MAQFTHQNITFDDGVKAVSRKEYEILVKYTEDLARAINEMDIRLKQLEKPEDNLKL